MYGQVLGISGWCMSAAFTYKQKVDFSLCADKTGFLIPGHIYTYSSKAWFNIQGGHSICTGFMKQL